MIAYLDSSVLLRILLDEKSPLKEFKSIELGVSSSLLKIECLRTLDRLKIENALSDDAFLEAREFFLSSFRKIQKIPITNTVVDLASQSWGVPLKTLDSIHLASALLWKRSEQEDLYFMTHDKKLGRAAAAQGLSVLGID